MVLQAPSEQDTHILNNLRKELAKEGYIVKTGRLYRYPDEPEIIAVRDGELVGITVLIEHRDGKPQFKRASLAKLSEHTERYARLMFKQGSVIKSGRVGLVANVKLGRAGGTKIELTENYARPINIPEQMVEKAHTYEAPVSSQNTPMASDFVDEGNNINLESNGDMCMTCFIERSSSGQCACT